MNVHLIASNVADLEVALGFLRISKQIIDMGEIRRARGVYVCTVKLAKPFKEVSGAISAKFGQFVQLRKP